MDLMYEIGEIRKLLDGEYEKKLNGNGDDSKIIDLSLKIDYLIIEFNKIK